MSEVEVESSAKWFTQLEDVGYSFVEYIPGLGSVYSGLRSLVAANAHDERRFAISLNNFVLGAIRDVTLLTGITEPPIAVIFHAVGENFSKKIYDIFHPEDPTKPCEVDVDDPEKYKDHDGIQGTGQYRSYFIAAGATKLESKKFAETLFHGKAKGLYHFHRSVFYGRIIEPHYARGKEGAPGEEIYLLLSEGFREGAPCSFTWKWTIDAHSPPIENRPDNTHGTISLTHTDTTGVTMFTLKDRKGYYNFWGEIAHKDVIKVTTRVEGENVVIMMGRQEQKHY